MSLRVPLDGMDAEYIDGRTPRQHVLGSVYDHVFNSDPSARPSIAAFDSHRIIIHAMEEEGETLRRQLLPS
jgi:hypothetical protein